MNDADLDVLYCGRVAFNFKKAERMPREMRHERTARAIGNKYVGHNLFFPGCTYGLTTRAGKIKIPFPVKIFRVTQSVFSSIGTQGNERADIFPCVVYSFVLTLLNKRRLYFSYNSVRHGIVPS